MKVSKGRSRKCALDTEVTQGGPGQPENPPETPLQDETDNVPVGTEHLTTKGGRL